MDILSKCRIWMSIAILGGFLGTAAMAQNAPIPGKIGCFSIRSVYANWNEKKTADENFKPERDKIEEQKKKLDVEVTALEKKKNTLAAKDYKAEREKLVNKGETLRKDYEAFMKDVQDKAGIMSERLDRIVNLCLKDISDKEGYSMILDSRSVYYLADTKADLTDKVIEFVNAYKGETGTAAKDAAKPAVKK